MTVNRLCGSGLEAVATAARAIRGGEAELCIAGGVESMTRAPYVMAQGRRAFAPRRRALRHHARLALRQPADEGEATASDAMGETAENVAERVRGRARPTRTPSRCAASSARHRRRRAAASRRRSSPVAVPQQKGDPIVVEQRRASARRHDARGARQAASRRSGDGGTRDGRQLRRGINDGAAALLLASERGGRQAYGLTPLARIVAAATAGVEPRVMGMGPVPATREAAARGRARRSAEIDVVELNEAFAAQALAVMRDLGLPTTRST